MDKVRFGVLGAGRGAGIARAMKYAPSAELVALCDMNEERLRQVVAATGVTQTYARYEDLLASDVNAVIVASPMPLHVEHSVQALKAGKHVLSEVTAATEMEQCWELLETVKSTGLKYMLAENYNYQRPWSIVVGMVEAGVFGDLYYGEADQIQEFKGGFHHPDSGYNWRTSELALRQGHQYITHNLGPLYQVFKERIKTVVCLGSGQRHLEWAKADSTCVVLLETETGRLLRIRLDFFSDRPNNFTYLGIQGVNAAYEAPRVHGRTERGAWENLWEYQDYLPEVWKAMPAEAVNDGYDGGSSIMVEDFARSIIDDTRPPIDVVDALNITAPGLLSEVSRARGGKPVDVPNFTG